MNLRSSLTALLSALLFVAPSFGAEIENLKAAYRVAAIKAEELLENPKPYQMVARKAFGRDGGLHAGGRFDFFGQNQEGEWQTVRLRVALDGTLSYDPEKDGPFRDHRKEHENPPMNFLKWIHPEEASVIAQERYKDYEPIAPISTNYYFNERLGGVYILQFQWLKRTMLLWVSVDAATGEILEASKS